MDMRLLSICDLDFLFNSDYQKYVTNLNNYMYLVVFFSIMHV